MKDLVNTKSDYLKPRQAGQVFGVSAKTVLRWIGRKLIPGYAVSARLILVKRTDIEAMLTRFQTGKKAACGGLELNQQTKHELTFLRRDNHFSDELVSVVLQNTVTHLRDIEGKRVRATQREIELLARLYNKPIFEIAGMVKQ